MSAVKAIQGLEGKLRLYHTLRSSHPLCLEKCQSYTPNYIKSIVTDHQTDLSQLHRQLSEFGIL